MSLLTVIFQGLISGESNDFVEYVSYLLPLRRIYSPGKERESFHLLVQEMMLLIRNTQFNSSERLHENLYSTNVLYFCSLDGTYYYFMFTYKSTYSQMTFFTHASEAYKKSF